MLDASAYSPLVSSHPARPGGITSRLFSSSLEAPQQLPDSEGAHQAMHAEHCLAGVTHPTTASTPAQTPKPYAGARVQHVWAAAATPLLAGRRREERGRGESGHCRQCASGADGEWRYMHSCCLLFQDIVCVLLFTRRLLSPSRRTRRVLSPSTAKSRRLGRFEKWMYDVLAAEAPQPSL
jgi:hypothetical protein